MNAPKRTRLSPQDRRTQLLDVTQTILVEQGLNSFTMEALATAASVSNPLVYKYFSTRLALLQELLMREFRRFYGHIRQELDTASNYQEVVRIVVTVNFDEYSKSNVLPILRSQPDVAEVLKYIGKKESNKLAKFLVSGVRDSFPLSVKQAETITVMASGASLAAAEHYSRFGGDRDQLIDDTVQFIFAGIRGFVSD